ncbi:hypothetical protein [Rhizobium sp. Root1220]|uniref:hypothetical protein n=1 Tax=Rhizobium sp. Root1220 TaxID=1736432 RepID=UPI000ACB51AD|nr:hypothetical protein [Rhizobium sp. Root1220]
MRIVPHDIHLRHEIEWQALRDAKRIEMDLEPANVTPAQSLGMRMKDVSTIAIPQP